MDDAERGAGLVERSIAPLPALPPLLVARRRLVDAVLRTPPGGCCVVSAAPGFGRTTLISQAARRWSGALVWTSSGAWPDDPDAFVAHLRALVGAGAALGPGEPTSVDGIVAAMAQSDALGRPVLVVDDVDPLTQPLLAAQVARLAQRLPEPWRMLVGLRRAVPPALARLRTSGRLVTVDEPELTLTPEEAADLVRLHDPELPAFSRDRLVSLAEGWVAALIESLRSHQPGDVRDPAGWLLSVGIDRLFEPVLDEMDPDDLDFLVRCSVLETLDPDACEAVTGDLQAGARLARLESEKWYLQRQAEPGRLRMHGLLAEHLRRLLAARGSRAAREVHLRGAAWAASTGDPHLAVRHLMAADDHAGALALIEENLEDVLNAWGFRAVHDWYAALPVEARQQHVHLLGAAWASLLAGDVSGADRPLADLEAAVDAVPGPRPDLPRGSAETYGGAGWLAAQVHLLRAYRASWACRLPAMRRHAEAAHHLFGDSWRARAPQVTALLLAHDRLWREDTAGARAVLADAAGRPGLSDFQRQVGLPSDQALLAAIEGRPWRAVHLADRVLAFLETTEETFAEAPLQARLARARAMVDLGEPEPAIEGAALLVERADSLGHGTYAVLGRITWARALAAAGRAGAAHQRLDEAAVLLRAATPDSPLFESVTAAEARLRLDRGDVVTAERLVRRLPRGNHRTLLTVRLAQARRAGSGLPDLATLRPHTPRETAESVVLVAAAALANGRRTEAERYLVSAGEVAEETGLVSVLVGAPEALVELGDRVARRGSYHGLQRLVDVGVQWRSAVSPAPRLDRPLSRGELELLALLPDRPSNEELAQHLSVSVNTVKTRLRRLYRKLGVSNRGEALREARDLRLVPPRR